MNISTELYHAAERTFYASGSKPKDVAAILNRLASDFGVEASVDGGLLCLKQNGSPASVGAILAAYRQKFPRDFFGEAGAVNFKSDLQGDTAAKLKFIREHGLPAWDALPANENSPGAANVVTDAIPSAGMKRAEYQRLSTAEKIKLCSEIGASGISKIMGRT
jgi:hypothetical protein